ncbi:MAG: leucine-rich repeat domain-containing protein [Mogibacterium sp.]|nr:leucine-rich repeat domain-containing protein [Mogibacterium sp.]
MLKKRTLSLLLTLAILLAFMPAIAFADDAADNTADQAETVAAEGTAYEDATAEDPAEENLSSEEQSGEQDETEIEGQSGKLADAVTWKLDAGVLTISGAGKMTDYESESAAPWYSERAKIKKIIIEDGITHIGQYAFVDFTGLERVEIPKSVVKIETEAFEVDVMLEDSCAAKTVYYKGDVASWCKITFGDIASSPCYAGGKLSFNGTDAVNLTIPGSVSSISDYAFYGCSSLKSVTLSEGIKSIGGAAFDQCENMTSVTIPKSLTYSGANAFSYCRALNDVYYNGDIASWCNIEFAWFSSNPCDNGCNLYFNKKPAGDQTIPEGSTSIGDFTFLGCKNLTGIVIPKSVKSIGRSAFDGCTGLKSVTLSEGLEDIGYCSFNGCSGLTDITIPASVKRIEAFAFDDCDKLKAVYYKGDLSKWCSIDIDAVSANPCCNGANLYFNGTKVTDLTVPGSLKAVSDFAFTGCSSLTSVKISDGVTSIGTCAFDSCSNITSVTIPDGVTNIGELSFADCSKLTSVTIPGSITAVGEAAFDGCKAIKEISYGGDKNNWKSFENVPDRGTIHYSDGSSEVLVPKKSDSDSDEQDDDSAEADSPDDGSHSCAGNIKKVSTAATCQAAGMKKHYECTVCHKMYKDAKGTKALTKKQIKKLKLKKKKHSFKKKSGEYLKSAATCTKPAIYYYTCKMCGQKGKKTYKSGKALGHKYENSVTKATPAKNGSIGQKCTVCGKKGKGKVIPKASKIAVVKKYKKKGVPTAALGGAFIEVRNAKGKKIAASEYDIAFSNDVEAGKGSATITFKGDNYEGSKVVSYKIVK